MLQSSIDPRAPLRYHGFAMRILLINHYAGSPCHGMEYRPYYLAREWVRQGHEVTIVAASFSHLRQQNPEFNTDLMLEDRDGIRYVWLRTPSYQGNGLGRIRNMMTFMANLYGHAEKIRAIAKPDVVIASSTYPLDIYPAQALARNAKLVYEVHDLWPLSPIELGGMSPYHPFIVTMQIAEDHAYRVADRVVSLLPKADTHMGSHGMAPEKFLYIPNGIDLAEWTKDAEEIPAEHAHTLQELKESGNFILGYAGSIGLANAMHHFVDAAALVQDQPIAFVVVGQGPEKEALIARAQRAGLKNIHFLAPVPKRSIPRLLERMDALYAGSHKVSIYRFGISFNKIIDYMMAGKPILQAIEAGNDPVGEARCGLSVVPEPETIADAALRLMKLSPESRAELGSNGHAFVKAHHDYAVLARQFIEGLL